MPVVQYSIQSSKFDLPLSPSDLAGRYFFGIPIVDQSGNYMSDEDLAFHIRAATEQVEGYLNLKLTKQIIEEDVSYYLNDYKAWGYIPTSFPCRKCFELVGRIGTVEQVRFPESWFAVKRNNEGTLYHRAIYLVPTSGTTDLDSVVYSGITPHVGWFGQQTIPYYWTIRYCTSFDRIPEDILDVVGKLASINVFHQLGDIILGAGIASQSIGIDGLSQSISTTSSATNAGYGARITGYLTDLKENLPRLKAKYSGFEIMSL